MALALFVIWLFGVALFGGNAIEHTQYTFLRLMAVLLWPIMVLVALGCLIALRFGWISANW